MIYKSTKTNTRFHQTDNRKLRIALGVLLSSILVATPFVFYIYKFAPSDSQEWHTIFGTIHSGGFGNVQVYMHALFTKIIFVLLTGIWFLTSQNWWKYAILIPFTTFLFQLSGVVNHKLRYIDEFDFWYSLPVVLPILFFLVYISFIVSKYPSENELKQDVDREIRRILSDEL